MGKLILALIGVVVLGLAVFGDVMLIRYLGSLVPVGAWSGLIRFGLGAVVVFVSFWILWIVFMFGLAAFFGLTDR